MKKLFMFLAVAGLATFGASCSSDDGGNDGGGNGGGDGKTQLVAKASPSTVEVNKEVTFSATADGKAVDGVKFYEGSTELASTHKFTTTGDKKIVAKKDGFKDSAVITVKVTEEATPPGPEKTLVLSLETDPADVKQGERFELKIVDGEGKPVTGATLLADGQSTGIDSTDGVFGVSYNGSGEIYLSAVKDGVYSNELTIEVHPGEPEPAPEGKITYDGVDNAVGGQLYGYLGTTEMGSLIVVQASSADGLHVAEAVLLAEPVVEGSNIVDFDFSNATVLDYYYYDGNTEEDYDLSVKDADDNAVVTSVFFDGSLNNNSASFKLTATMESGKVLDVLTDGSISFLDLSQRGAKAATSKSNFVNKYSAKGGQKATLKVGQFTAM